MKNTTKKPAKTVTFREFSALAEGLTDAAIGDLLGVSRQTAHRWRTSGTVSATKPVFYIPTGTNIDQCRFSDPSASYITYTPQQ